MNSSNILEFNRELSFIYDLREKTSITLIEEFKNLKTKMI